MAIRVSNVKTTAPKDFPKLMISDAGQIVLFNSYKKGVLLVSVGSAETIGWVSDGWIMANFRDYDGTVTLENS